MWKTCSLDAVGSNSCSKRGKKGLIFSLLHEHSYCMCWIVAFCNFFKLSGLSEPQNQRLHPKRV